jgi:hypothetical protein
VKNVERSILKLQTLVALMNVFLYEKEVQVMNLHNVFDFGMA